MLMHFFELVFISIPSLPLSSPIQLSWHIFYDYGLCEHFHWSHKSQAFSKRIFQTVPVDAINIKPKQIWRNGIFGKVFCLILLFTAKSNFPSPSSRAPEIPFVSISFIVRWWILISVRNFPIHSLFAMDLEKFWPLVRRGSLGEKIKMFLKWIISLAFRARRKGFLSGLKKRRKIEAKSMELS